MRCDLMTLPSYLPNFLLHHVSTLDAFRCFTMFSYQHNFLQTGTAPENASKVQLSAGQGMMYTH